MDELTGIYIEDMKEYLGILNDSILSLERSPGDIPVISEMFRAFHTMKSSTAAMEFKNTAGFIHRMEDLLQEIRDGRIAINEDIIKLFYIANDLLEKFLANVIRQDVEDDHDYSPIMDMVSGIISAGGRTGGQAPPHKPAPANGGSGFVLKEPDVRTLKEALQRGAQAYVLTAAVAESSVFKSVRAWMVLEELERQAVIIASDPEKTDPEDFKNGNFNFSGTRVRAVIVLEEAGDSILQELNLNISEIGDIELDPIRPDFEPGMDFDVLSSACLAEAIDGIIGNDEDMDDMDKKQKEEEPGLKAVQTEMKEDGDELKDMIQALRRQSGAKAENRSQAYIRVPAAKVDNLVDLLGELIIAQSLHKQNIAEASGRENNRLLNSMLRMERIAKDIQDITMSLRMVSLKQTFQKIYRIGRDTAAELGKNVDIAITGEDTEIDRSIVEKIHDPMMHLIRNSISHGIEPQEERLGAGKPAAGSILIQAYNRRGNVYIEIADDGRGMSVERIMSKALEKGLADPAGRYSEDEILRFIYLPGFSTEECVNSISGRGVGMNVVQTEIARLGGKIDIHNKPGRGCAFILKIPVNLATINGTIVDIASCKYIIPTLNIKQILKPGKDQWISVKGKRSMVLVRNEILQVIPIGRILDSGPQDGEGEAGLIVVVEHEQKLMALPVRAIDGKQDVVVKSLGGDFRNLNFVSGATILGDGRVSLILDIDALFRMTEDPRLENIRDAV